MKNKEKWVPSKYIYRKGKLVGSRNPKELGIASRLAGDIVASLYDTYIPKYVKGKLIDLGCGKVPLFEAYRNYIRDSVCVDWKSSLNKNEYLDYECDLTQKLPFNNSEFDTIILSDVLEHISQPEKLWQEITRVLVPHGKVIMSTPFYYGLHEGPYDYYRYTEYAIRRFADLAGFKILILKPLGGMPEILADILAKNFISVPLIGKNIAVVLQYITYIFIRTAVGKKISERTSRTFPLGYFLVAEKISE